MDETVIRWVLRSKLLSVSKVKSSKVLVRALCHHAQNARRKVGPLSGCEDLSGGYRRTVALEKVEDAVE